MRGVGPAGVAHCGARAGTLRGGLSDVPWLAALYAAASGLGLSERGGKETCWRGGAADSWIGQRTIVCYSMQPLCGACRTVADVYGSST